MLDTNTCIFAIRGARKDGSPYQCVVDKLKQETEIIISAITYSELCFGVELSEFVENNKEALENFLSYVDVVDYDAFAAEEYGKIRAGLKKKNSQIGTMDMLIAAHAKALGVTLVTNNTRDFERIDGLTLEDWK
jgi:tRNA(fMet)-specific endonuclease VapC